MSQRLWSASATAAAACAVLAALGCASKSGSAVPAAELNDAAGGFDVAGSETAADLPPADLAADSGLGDGATDAIGDAPTADVADGKDNAKLDGPANADADADTDTDAYTCTGKPAPCCYQAFMPPGVQTCGPKGWECVSDVAYFKVCPGGICADICAATDLGGKPDTSDGAGLDTATDLGPADTLGEVSADIDAADVAAPDGGGDSAGSDAGPVAGACTAGTIWLKNTCVASSATLRAGDAETTASNTIPLHLLPPGNLLVNGGAESGDFSGWTTTTGGDPWVVITGDAPFGGRFFRGSFAWGYLSQTVDFTAAGISATDLDAGVVLHFGVFGVGWGFVSSAGKLDTFKLDLSFQDAAGAELGTWSSGDVALKVDEWGVASVDTTTYPVGTRKASFRIGAIDGEYWKGTYGPSIDGASVAVGGLDIRISNGDGSWSAWSPFTAQVATWALTPGAGLKTVQVEFRDAQGVSLGVVTDTVTVQ